MLNRFYWVIENEIAGMAVPTASRAYLYLEDADPAAEEEMRREIRELQNHGIGAVVSLTETPLAAHAFQEAGLDYLHLPIPDMTAPTQSQIHDFIEFVRRHAHEQKAVAVHCLSGAGRTGTMLACYLVAKGYEPNQAIQAIRQHRPGAIETRWQEEAIFEYALEAASE